MQDIKVELLKLLDGLNEEQFDFLDTILVIEEQFDSSDIFSSFCNIWKIEEAKDHDEVDENIVNFVIKFKMHHM